MGFRDILHSDKPLLAIFQRVWSCMWVTSQIRTRSGILRAGFNHRLLHCSLLWRMAPFTKDLHGFTVPIFLVLVFNSYVKLPEERRPYRTQGFSEIRAHSTARSLEGQGGHQLVAGRAPPWNVLNHAFFFGGVSKIGLPKGAFWVWWWLIDGGAAHWITKK